MTDISIEEQFRYHPPKTETRIAKHTEVNEAALNFAKVIEANISDRVYRDRAIQWVQVARMIANQAITFEEIEA